MLSSDTTFCRNATNKVSSCGNRLGGKGVSPLDVEVDGVEAKLIICPGRLIVGVAGVDVGV
jgi:hypothetical protein